MAIEVSLNQVTRELRRQFDALGARETARNAASAINKVLAKDRVLIGREIRRQYRMNTFDAKAQIPQTLASVNKLIGTLSGNAGFTPMEYFSITAEDNNTGSEYKIKRAVKYAMINGKKMAVGRNTTTTGSGRHATFTVNISAGKSSLFTHAFLANTVNGPMLFNRGTYGSRTNVFNSISSRNPMERLRTLSVWQEINSQGIRGKSEALLEREYTTEFTRLMQLSLTTKGSWR